jgi:antitoxin PrlF
MSLPYAIMGGIDPFPVSVPVLMRELGGGDAAPISPVPIDDKQQICYSALMKATITVTSRGVVTLPLGIRKALGIKADDTLIAETTPDGLLLRPAVTLPVEIYSDKRIREFDEAEEDLAVAMRRTPPTGRKSARRRG